MLGEAIGAFLETIPSDVHYYGMGGDVEIPTSAELSLIRIFETLVLRSRDDVTAIAGELSTHQAYVLATFSVRMAIFAARTNALLELHASTFGMVIDDNLLDWRDVLVALSVIEDCAVRIGTDLSSIMQGAINVASDRRRYTIVSDYLSRSPEMRGIKVMGIEALGSGEKLRYRQKSSTS
ncbi:MAG TPA: hypothetical protein VG269_02070 [Tepidisphaeraceae bacterium]|nr:hypothetical protein [Tepidisphaeraceae bacterium]